MSDPSFGIVVVEDEAISAASSGWPSKARGFRSSRPTACGVD
jgi:hypothetical protein